MVTLKNGVEVLSTPTAVAERVAAWLLDLALAKSGNFSLCLSGGATPGLLYQRLAQAPYRSAFPWSRTHVFWGDERFVPPDDARSNFGVVRERLLSHVPLPAAHIHAIPTVDLTLAAATAFYQLDLQAYYGACQLDPGRPLFDVTLLGLGLDGHTASLFPKSAALTQRTRWVAAVVEAKDAARITLTYPALESSGETAFLVTGAEKADVLGRLLKVDASLPAAHLQPVGALRVFADTAAAEAPP